MSAARRKRKPVEAEEKKKRMPTTRYTPDYRKGLTSQQVQEHKLHGWTNQAVDSTSKTTKEIVQENVFTYFNLIFLVLAVLLCLVGAFRDLTFLPVIIANTLIGIIQEIRAKKVLDDLTMLNAPHAMVVRDGKKSMIDAEELVVDDIVIFKAGAQVCADAEVCAGEVQVNESLLTGESDEITKKKGSKLMSGSFIVSGQCHARLDKVGEDSYISRLTLEAKEMQQGEQSEMIRSLDRLVKCVGIAIIPIGIILFVQAFFFQHSSFRSSVTSMVAAVIGMIPEGLYLLASVALAVSSMRLAQKKVLLHDMKCIETLARVDVLCVDKTGTITENTMQVQKLIPTQQYDPDTMKPLETLVGDFAAAMTKDNITMAAVKAYFTSVSGAKPVAKTGFSSATKYSSVTFEEGAYVLGAPEFVLLDEYEAYEAKITSLASTGARVLVFGTYDGTIDGKALRNPICPLGYILLANPIRDAAKETFQYFAEQGVEVKVISGDNPVTVSEIAKKAGIRHAEKQVDAATLKTAEAVRKAAKKYTVFGRVTPEQKRLLVQALKEQGKTVAMTGDGVNDILALKDADCSIAMASGSEAASHVAQLVLLDNDFNKMPAVVMEGRRVVNNIGRTASLYLVKNIFSMLLAVFSMLFLIDYPLEPSQVSLISVFTIGIPSFFLALEQNRNQIHGHFLTNVLIQALPAGITDFIVVSGLVIFCREFGVEKECVSTSCTILIAVVGFMILYHIAKPMTTPHAILIAAMVIGWLFCMLFFSELFAITAVTGKCAMLMIVFAVITEPVFRYLIQLVETVQKWGGKLKF